jgi:hypothetical protein
MANKITVRKEAGLENYFVFYDGKANKVTAVRDDHLEAPLTPDGLKLIGYPVARCEKDAINYVTQVRTEKQIKGEQ